MKEEDIKAYSNALVTATATERVKVEKELAIEATQIHGQWRLRVYDGRTLVYTTHYPEIESAHKIVMKWIENNYTVIGE